MTAPKENSYLITVELTGVTKYDAMLLASIYENAAGIGLDTGKIAAVRVVTSHIKDISGAPE